MPPVPSGADPRSALLANLTTSHLFQAWGGESLKLYLWLRPRARRTHAEPGEAGQLQQGYLEAVATGAEIEQAIGVSKNTVTKAARELQDLGVATYQADRTGYRFRLGEWLSRPALHGRAALSGEAYYLDALLAGQIGVGTEG
jgi:hypothetical protein